jgi:hypothetical protein
VLVINWLIIFIEKLLENIISKNLTWIQRETWRRLWESRYDCFERVDILLCIRYTTFICYVESEWLLEELMLLLISQLLHNDILNLFFYRSVGSNFLYVPFLYDVRSRPCTDFGDKQAAWYSERLIYL